LLLSFVFLLVLLSVVCEWTVGTASLSHAAVRLLIMLLKFLLLSSSSSLLLMVTSVAQHTVAELHADWSAATLTSDLTYNHFRRNLTGSAWSDFIFRYHVAFSQTSPVVRPHLFARGTRCGLLLPMFRGLCVGLRVSVICLAVYSSRREPCNTTEPIETLFGVWNRGGRGTVVLDGAWIHSRKATLLGRAVARILVWRGFDFSFFFLGQRSNSSHPFPSPILPSSPLPSSASPLPIS